MKSCRTARIFRLLTILQSGRKYTAADLAKMFGTSPRTTFRDLKCLSEAGIHYRFDTSQRAYSTDSQFFMPPLALTKGEAFALLLLAYEARNHINMPYADLALRAALKVESRLEPGIRQDCNRLLRHISVQPEPQAVGYPLDKMFAQLQQAIINRRIINIHYKIPSPLRSIVTELHPYHLLYSRHAWHVIGRASVYCAVHSFELNHISELQISGKRFIQDRKFDVHEHLGRAWSTQPEGCLYNIKLWFSPKVADSVTAVRWHQTQSVEWQQDGSAVVEFRVDGLSEVTWWILSYGDHVEVLAPRILRQRITKIAQRMVRSTDSGSAVTHSGMLA